MKISFRFEQTELNTVNICNKQHCETLIIKSFINFMLNFSYFNCLLSDLLCPFMAAWWSTLDESGKIHPNFPSKTLTKQMVDRLKHDRENVKLRKKSMHEKIEGRILINHKFTK